jgi:hypothetical protein
MKASDAIAELAKLPAGLTVGKLQEALERNGYCKSSADFPLLFETPIFMIHGKDADCPFWHEFPSDILPTEPITNIVFVCDFFDYAHLIKGYTFDDLAHLAQRLETHYVASKREKTK